MVEIETGLALLGSSQIALKILGPTADYVGQGLKDWSEKRVQNVKAILGKAEKKLGEKINEKGAVPPRVLSGILQDGSFCDDDLSAEYFGGVLASSRTGTPRDDRAATLTALLGRLSAYQIRAHFVFYTVFRRLYKGSGLHVGDSGDRLEMRTHVPSSVLAIGMDFSEAEGKSLESILAHTMFGLHQEALIDAYFEFGGVEISLPSTREIRIVVGPSVLGAQLYLAAHGLDMNPDEFINPELKFSVDTEVNVPDGSAPVASR